MADQLAQRFGTEKDRVNCPFYIKIGYACIETTVPSSSGTLVGALCRGSQRVLSGHAGMGTDVVDITTNRT